MLGYAIYLFIHYVVHARKPPKNFLKYLWTHHSLHHYVFEDRAFGVSSPLWDIIFKTMPPKIEKGFKKQRASHQSTGEDINDPALKK